MNPRIAFLLLCALLAACTRDARDPARGLRALGAGDAAAADLHPTCAKVGYAGCCGPAQTLVYCVGGAPVVKSCVPALCGWDPAVSLYVCGASAAPEPSGAIPRACPGSDAGPQADAPRDGPGPEAAGSCGPLGYVGCCAGSKLLYCAGGSVLELECGPAASCGWSASGARYECGASSASEPSGAHPRACSALFGDGGPRLDGARDLAAKDQGAADQPRDREASVVDAAAGERSRADTSSRRDAGLDARARELASGLDPSGLERAADRSGSIGRVSGGGGCSCELAAPPRWSLSPLLVVLLLGPLLARRRRGTNAL